MYCRSAVLIRPCCDGDSLANSIHRMNHTTPSKPHTHTHVTQLLLSYSKQPPVARPRGGGCGHQYRISTKPTGYFWGVTLPDSEQSVTESSRVNEMLWTQLGVKHLSVCSNLVTTMQRLLLNIYFVAAKMRQHLKHGTSYLKSVVGQSSPILAGIRRPSRTLPVGHQCLLTGTDLYCLMLKV